MNGQPRSLMVWEDMLIRDERAFSWIAQRRTDDGLAQFTLPELADELKCHENTARAIVDRLIGAEKIQVAQRKYDGYVYKVLAA